MQKTVADAYDTVAAAAADAAADGGVSESLSDAAPQTDSYYDVCLLCCCALLTKKDLDREDAQKNSVGLNTEVTTLPHDAQSLTHKLT